MGLAFGPAKFNRKKHDVKILGTVWIAGLQEGEKERSWRDFCSFFFFGSKERIGREWKG